MARTKVTLKKGEKRATRLLMTRVVVHAEERVKGPSSPVHPPSPVPHTPLTADEIMKRIVGAE